MVAERASFELIFPDSLIKTCSELVSDAKFEVNGIYLEDPDTLVTIQGLYKNKQLSFLLQDDILGRKLATAIRFQITSAESLSLSQTESTKSITDTETEPQITKCMRRRTKKGISKLMKKPALNRDSSSFTDSSVIDNNVIESSSGQIEHHCQNDGNENCDHSDVEDVSDQQHYQRNENSDEIGSNTDKASDIKSKSLDTLMTVKLAQPDTVVLLNVLQCNLCHELSNSIDELEAHVLKNHQLAWHDFCQLNIDALAKLTSDDPSIKCQAAKALSRWELLSQSNTRVTRLQSKQKELAFRSVYSCSYCERTFAHRKGLNVHIRDTHNKSVKVEITKETNEISAQLNELSKVALFKEISERSIEIAVANDMLTANSDSTVCLVCEKVFTGSRWSLRTRLPRHIETQHQISLEKYKELLDADSQHKRMCLAQEIIATQWNRKKERKTQLLGGKSQFRCSGCGRQYCAFNNLMKHIRVAHKNEEGFKQILLSAEEQGSAAYRPEMKAREQLEMTCAYCGVKRIGSCILKHLKNVHSDEKTFEEELKRATEEHTNRINEREKERKKKGPQVIHEDRMFECQYCGKQFKHRQARYRHSRFKCPENAEKCKKLWCRCGKGFLTKDTLAKHKIKCDKREKKFMCHLCGKMYGTASGLYIHKQTAHCDTVGGKYKHACEVCGKVFYRKQHYDRHIPKHSDERSCQCEICGKRFKTKEDIRKHQYAVHFHKYTYYCKDCGHGMNKLAYLKSHKCGRVRRQQASSVTAAKNQPRFIKPEQVGNILETEQQVLCDETGEVSADRLSIAPLPHSRGSVHEGISQMFQGSTADSAYMLQNTLPIHQSSPATLQAVPPSATYETSANNRGIVGGEQEVELSIQNMVVHHVADMQAETGQSSEAANLLEMTTYDGLQMLPGDGDYSLLQGTTTSVMIQQPSVVLSEPVSLTTPSPAVSQSMSTSYTVPQTYQIIQNSFH